MDKHARFIIAQQIYLAKDYDKAFDLFSELESEDFKDYEMFIILGHIYFHHKGFSNAYQRYLKAHEMDVSNPYPLMRMLKCHDAMNLPVEMFMEDHFNELLMSKGFSDKELKKIKLIYQKQNKVEAYDHIEREANLFFSDLEKKKAQFQTEENLEKQIDQARSNYLANVKHTASLKTYIELLEKAHQDEAIRATLEQAYHNINHFEVDYLFAKHCIVNEKRTEATKIIERMQARLKKHEDDKKMIKFYEYQKLAELHKLLGNEALYQFYNQKRLDKQSEKKTRKKGAKKGDYDGL